MELKKNHKIYKLDGVALTFRTESSFLVGYGLFFFFYLTELNLTVWMWQRLKVGVGKGLVLRYLINQGRRWFVEQPLALPKNVFVFFVKKYIVSNQT